VSVANEVEINNAQRLTVDDMGGLVHSERHIHVPRPTRPRPPGLVHSHTADR